MVCDFKLTWTDYIHTIINLIREEYTIIQLRCDAAFSGKAEGKSSDIDVFLLRLKKDYNVAQVSMGKCLHA